jgi:hypothetical protein
MHSTTATEAEQFLGYSCRSRENEVSDEIE